MRIYIENMEKPKKCDDCPFCGYDERQSILFCRVDNEDIEQDLRDDCPLIKIDLVRCGECKCWDKADRSCGIRDSYGWEYKPTDFCSYGERRSDDLR